MICVSEAADRLNHTVHDLITLKICLMTIAQTALAGSLLSFSVACLGCPRAAMTSCGRQSYREVPIS